MPELPEVETVVRTLRPGLIGARIVAARLTRTDIVWPAGVDLVRFLTGRRVESVERRGKRIIVVLDDANRFYVHLGMTGQLMLADPVAPVPPHTHFAAELSSGRQLRFRDPRRFGGIWWLGREHALADARMGPEPLAMRDGQLATRLACTTRAIKSALLDQTLVAGLGNIYVDEALFAAGIHPLARADQLTGEQVRRLNRAIKTTLRRAIRHRGSTLRDYRTADGDAGAFQSQHRVYHRAGQPCAKCRTPIERTVLGGRSTHFCPKCQAR